MTRPELWSIIDSLARSFPPGGQRLSPDEIQEWLGVVATSKRAHRETRRDAKRAAKHVHKLITGTYEMPNWSATVEEAGAVKVPMPASVSEPEPNRKPARLQPSLPGFGDDEG